MEDVVLINDYDRDLNLERFATYYLFFKWLKTNYPEFYLLYGEHFRILPGGTSISVRMHHIITEDNAAVEKMLNDFNERRGG